MNRLVLLTVACVAIAGCARDKAPPPPPDTLALPNEPVVGEGLLAFLSAARSLHHEANLHEGENDWPAAIGSLEKLLHLKRPGVFPEVEEVLSDTYARLAEYRLRTGDLVGASANVTDGLTHAKKDGYFYGHLLEVSGTVDEARAAQFLDAGKNDAASAAREDAFRKLREAVRVQEHVIEESLSDGGTK